MLAPAAERGRSAAREVQVTEVISLEGPVELVNGKLMIRIPLALGGDKLAPFARGIGEVDGEFLNVVIQPWLAEKLRIEAGSLVFVGNKDGKFTISGLDAGTYEIEAWHEKLGTKTATVTVGASDTKTADFTFNAPAPK